eukprot:CAMPEP_0172200958 /NCGR_PEP_ID=MMETSP1050-20130122/29675_1 /TAXON_ID=233186 /ORGANISM="Cryptomonas curvata, Strain CCAP979/52" /LENGTH=383 /DNA_ID=CAMNT_0012878435 /DNA_START=194 /DNA_END=1345 /DNA_ORIENTATION=-
MYWLALVAINSKHYDVDKVAPFLSQKDEENGDLGKFRRPKILFDGCAWAFGFELGVCQHLLKNYDIQGANCEVYAISAGNLPALCLLLEKVVTQCAYDYMVSRVLLTLYLGPGRGGQGAIPSAVAGHAPKPLLAAALRLLWRSLPGPLVPAPPIRIYSLLCFALVTLHIFACEASGRVAHRWGQVRRVLETMLDSNAHVRATGRYHVLVSRYPWLGFRVINSFRSKAELIDAVVSSMSLPGFVYRPQVSCYPGWRGLWLDPGLQNVITPLDTNFDVFVRTFVDHKEPLHRDSVFPPAHLGITLPFSAVRTMTLVELLDQIRQSDEAVAGHKQIIKTFAPFRRCGTNCSAAAPIAPAVPGSTLLALVAAPVELVSASTPPNMMT